jgi:hypothetical protein
MFSFKFNSNSAQVNRRMSNLVGSQMPYAVARALNETAKTLHAKNKQDMRLAFENPTPFTLNAYFIKFAKKSEQSVVIRRKDMQRGKHYLEVQDEGGPRPRKGVESNFRTNLAWGGPVNYLTPTRRTETNKYGNVSSGFMNKVMSQLQVQRDPAMNMNTQKPRKRKSQATQYFVPSTSHPLGQGIRAGVYERTPAGNAKKVLSFLTFPPIYRPRTNFHAKMTRYGQSVFPKKLKKTMSHAMRTARLR